MSSIIKDVLRWLLIALPYALAVFGAVLLALEIRKQDREQVKKWIIKGIKKAAWVIAAFFIVFLAFRALAQDGRLVRFSKDAGGIINILVSILSYIAQMGYAILFKWILPAHAWLIFIGCMVLYICLKRPHYTDMFRYIGKRLLMFIPVIIIISFVIYFVIQLPPGDYVSSYVSAMAAEGEIFTAEDIQELRVHYGLDQPWYLQYLDWITGIVVEGDFGYSFEYGRDVWSVIMDRLYLTLGVSFVILIFQYGVSLPIGIYCANHQYSAGDYIWSFFGFLGTATPNFLLAILIMYWIYIATGQVYLGLFSTEMMQNGMRWEYVPEFLFRCLIPLIVIGTSGTCGIIRTVRAQMLDEKSRQYTLTARAKGCSEATITYKYCLRAALNPVVSGMAGSLRTIFSGSTVSAIVMNLQIQGPVLLTALKSQDMYLAGTIVMIQAVLVVVGTLLSDIALAWLDPRIRFSERS